MTLIELLVVVAIMAMLAAYMLPKLEPMARERKIREAARSVNVFLNRARSRAIETGRPCGVVFERFITADTTDPRSNASAMLYQAEVPPPYAGDTLDARVTMTLSPLAANVSTGSIQSGLIRVGDLIQINGQGPWYTINDNNTNTDGYVTSTTQFFLSVDLQYHNSLPWSDTASTPLPFTILRRPVRTIAQPLSLPVGAAVDLSASGTDELVVVTGASGIPNAPAFAAGIHDVIIMFSPNGSVKQYYCDAYPSCVEATDPIFLLIGWREQVPQVGILAPNVWTEGNFDEDALPNWQVLSNLWIALNPQPGLISVADNAYPEDTYRQVYNAEIPWSVDKGQPRALLESRTFARRAQSKGGR